MGDKLDDKTRMLPGTPWVSTHPAGNVNPSGRPLRRQRAIPGDKDHRNNGLIRDPRHPTPIPGHHPHPGTMTLTTETVILPPPLITITNSTQGATVGRGFLPREADTTPGPASRLPVWDPTEDLCLEMVARRIRKIHTATIPITEAAGHLPRDEEACHKAADESTEASIPEVPEAPAVTVEGTVVLLGVAAVPSTRGNTVDSTTVPVTRGKGTRRHPITAATHTRVGDHHLPPDTTHRPLRRGAADNRIPEVVTAAETMVTTIPPIDTVITAAAASLLRTTGEAHRHLTRIEEARLLAIPNITGITRSLLISSSNSKRAESAEEPRAWSSPRGR